MIPGPMIVSPDAAPVKRVVVDIDLLELTDTAKVPDDISAAEWADTTSLWYISEKLRLAGVPVSPLSGRLHRGVLTWFDLCDKPVRRYIWEEV